MSYGNGIANGDKTPRSLMVNSQTFPEDLPISYILAKEAVHSIKLYN